VRHPVGTRPCQFGGMDEFFIGAGALLRTGPPASITGATLHAQTDPALKGRVEAAVVDFEAGRLAEVSRLLIVAARWSGRRFHEAVVERLLDRRECTLGDVVVILSEATGTREVHLFARWVPDHETAALLKARGIGIVAHPLEAIGQAALVSGQRLERWAKGVQVAPRVRKHDAA
jgi:hypothetical protein